MTKLAILGYAGRMGQAIAQEIENGAQATLAAGLVVEGQPLPPERKGILVSTKPDEVIAAAEVLINFTLADATLALAELTAKHKKPFMTGVTGLSDNAVAALKKLSQDIPILYAPNTSVSLAVMKPVTALAAKLLRGFDYDISILDEHHRMKQDSPSGTAKALGEAILSGNGGTKQPAYAAVRAGAIVGEHEVAFVGQGEIIRLRHSVTDRAIFARGAVKAALWLHGKPPGFYGMGDVIGL
ncbi:MAG: 4-hydroxy-tetrahydrodipicolinate reductase [Bdellovibrionales bacterium]